MKFFEIVKYHPTYCAVSMPPAYLNQLSWQTNNNKINSLSSISVIGSKAFENDNFYTLKNNLHEYQNELNHYDEKTEKFYKSFIDINLL